PIVLAATVLSEFITPIAEIKSSEANLLMRGRVEGGRLVSGYWFKEPTSDGGTRIINIGRLLASGNAADLRIYEFPDGTALSLMSTAESARFVDGNLIMENVIETRISPEVREVLADAKVSERPVVVKEKIASRKVETTLSAERLVARILTPERMTLKALHDYIQYLDRNQLQSDRQVVAVWRKLAYPFTLVVMLTIAAPIGFMQTRRGGVGAKVFLGILLGTGFFMINQLALNVGLLYKWPPVVTALLPNVVATLLALTAIFAMEHRNAIISKTFNVWLGRKSAV
ncbi:MAG: LptF/LptG family permease, partial [Alcaligenaceae bacterium]